MVVFKRYMVMSYDSGWPNYTPYNATSTWFIAPGQAFFASANASGSSVAFNENMQNASLLPMMIL